jgi:actin-like ATPase involved in cell morphogenesis
LFTLALAEIVWLNIGWPWIFFLLAIVVPGVGIFISHLIDLKPEITFVQENIHVAPSKGNWQIKAECRASAAGQIEKCVWKQLEPTPGNINSTVLQGGAKECLRISSEKVDASLKNLKIPYKDGKYKFELTCTDNYNRKNTQQFFVMIGEKATPIVFDMKNHLNVSIKSPSVQLYANCQASRGYIVDKWWKYISGPPDVGEIKPSKVGNIKFPKAGVYTFEYKCKDNYGEQSRSQSTSSIMRVAVKPPYVLGIDLGTSTTCVSYMSEDGIKRDIKLNGKDYEPCMPSVVAFADNGELLIGKRALNQAVLNPLSTIYEVKRLMGQNYYDVDDHNFIYRVRPTLKSHSSKGTRVAIDIPCKGHKRKLIQPEVISALILHRVVEIAQIELGVTIKDVIISVPAQFDDAQRKATMDAGRIAGLNPQKIVNEPTVAAFAAATFIDNLRGTEDDAEVPKPKITTPSVVVDIGGGTSDFSYMHIHGSFYKVIATDGDKTLGGRDIDIRLADKMTKMFKERITDRGIDLKSPEFQQNLRMECEKAKIELSKRDNYTLLVKINVADQGSIHLDHILNRSQFVNYTEDILKSMIKPLDSLLSRGNITRDFVKELYLVGGTVHIPKLQELLKIYFPNVTANRTYSKDPVQVLPIE